MGRLRTNSFLFPGGRCLLCVLCVQIAFTLAIVLTRGSGHLGTADPAAVDGVLGTVAGVLILMAVYTGSRGIRAQYQERTRARGITDLMETVLNTRREWWWAVDAKENFTFSSSACISLLGTRRSCDLYSHRPVLPLPA